MTPTAAGPLQEAAEAGIHSPVTTFIMLPDENAGRKSGTRLSASAIAETGPGMPESCP